MLLTLKIVGGLIAAAGAILALYARDKDHRLTRHGKAYVVLAVLGAGAFVSAESMTHYGQMRQAIAVSETAEQQALANRETLGALERMLDDVQRLALPVNDVAFSGMIELPRQHPAVQSYIRRLESIYSHARTLGPEVQQHLPDEQTPIAVIPSGNLMFPSPETEPDLAMAIDRLSVQVRVLRPGASIDQLGTFRDEFVGSFNLTQTAILYDSRTQTIEFGFHRSNKVDVVPQWMRSIVDLQGARVFVTPNATVGENLEFSHEGVQTLASQFTIKSATLFLSGRPLPLDLVPPDRTQAYWSTTLPATEEGLLAALR